MTQAVALEFDWDEGNDPGYSTWDQFPFTELSAETLESIAKMLASPYFTALDRVAEHTGGTDADYALGVLYVDLFTRYGVTVPQMQFYLMKKTEEELRVLAQQSKQQLETFSGYGFPNVPSFGLYDRLAGLQVGELVTVFKSRVKAED